jgi:hypothetical protein
VLEGQQCEGQSCSGHDAENNLHSSKHIPQLAARTHGPWGPRTMGHKWLVLPRSEQQKSKTHPVDDEPGR